MTRRDREVDPPHRGPAAPPATRLRADARANRVRVLEAAEQVFGTTGVAASMEEIAATAGVGIGTLYRNFPTKEALLQAVHVNRLARLVADAEELAAAPEPGEALFGFFTLMVEQSRVKRTYVAALSEAGVDDEPVRKVGLELRHAIEGLLHRAREAGTVRPEVEIPELMALLAGACLAAEHAGWDATLQARTLQIIFTGLRPAPQAPGAPGGERIRPSRRATS
ncbi:TetR/AcrR family transcriptional regulator [Dactylosporangium sp. NBC_01737]|uniref:TetR/AcrR family transcriptional regulator n=1 Tax=Dactylosporangium sp. NBC_01737 TaxID=2975959 RepID=UPI002E1219D4|nr:TetR/AcrR family transcriptional regulator [Dactylosporangium sp. NBC_01737]